MDSNEIEQLIKEKFPEPTYAFLSQVRNGTGFSKLPRTADAIAMCLYPSRGLHLHGFEIKVYRNDWLNELKNPDKAEEISQFCDFWWIVACPEVVNVIEVPVNWGLMSAGKSLKVIKEAKLLTVKPIDKLFLAAILRRAQSMITPEAKLLKAFKDGQEAGMKYKDETFKSAYEKHQLLIKEIETFEKASGVRIGQYHNNEQIGKAVYQVLHGEHVKVKQRLEQLLYLSEEITKHIKEELAKDI